MYQRQKVEFPALTELFNGAEVYIRPRLPMITIKKDKATYKITDVRLLNEKAVSVLKAIIDQAIKDPEIDEVCFKEDGITIEELQMLGDIVMGVEYEVKERGGEFHGVLICDGIDLKGIDKTETVAFHVIKENARRIHEYARGKENVNFFDMCIEVAKRKVEEYENRT